MKNKQPSVNIVILNYNGKKDTIECINSLLKIDHINYKILLVDNGSKDNSLREFRKKYSKNKKINLIENKENYGFAKGNNEAIKSNFDSDYFLLLNNDTTVKKDFLTKLVYFAEENKKVGVVSPQINKYSKKNEINPQNLSGKFNLWLGGGRPLIPKNKPYKADYTSGCCWLIKKEVIEKTNGFNENYFLYKEEIEWAYRINKVGYSFYVVPSSQIYHKGEQSTKKIKGLRQHYEIRNSLFFVREYGNFLQKAFFICYVLSYKLLKQLFLNFKSKNTWKEEGKFFKGIKEGLLNSYK